MDRITQLLFELRRPTHLNFGCWHIFAAGRFKGKLTSLASWSTIRQVSDVGRKPAFSMQYRYASTYDGRNIDIEGLASIGRAKGEKYLCLGCGRELIPVLGKVKEQHFRHKADIEPACTPESYLHALAKRTFADSYRAAVAVGNPYYLTLPTKRVCKRWEKKLGFACHRENGAVKYDLTTYFDMATLEQRTDGFIADVLLTSSRSHERMLVEIAVTHKCDPSKVASGLRILELHIDHDGKISAFVDGVDATLPWVQLHNFKEQSPIDVACSRACGAELSMFIVYKSGKSILISDHPSVVWAVQHKPAVVYSRIVEETEQGLALGYLAADGGYRREAEIALKSGAPIKCCSICRYAGFQTWEKPVFCKIKKMEVGVNEAASCEAYRPEVRNLGFAIILKATGNQVGPSVLSSHSSQR